MSDDNRKGSQTDQIDRSAWQDMWEGRRTTRYAAVGLPVAFLAAENGPVPATDSSGSLLGLLGMVAKAGGELFVQQPLLTTALVAGLGGAGYLKFKADIHLNQYGDGFATRQQLKQRMGRRQLVKRRAVLRPSLADVPGRKVPTSAVGVYLGKDRKTGVEVFAAIEDSTLLLAPMGSGKTGKLGNWVLDAVGPVVATSTKYDIVELTEELRGQQGTCWIFNPQGLNDRRSTLLWDPVVGCADPVTGPETAMRRARYLLEGSDATKGVENRNFWQTASYRVLKAFLWAADVEGLSLLDVARWSKQPHDTPALEIFEKRAAVAPDGWADDLKQVQEIKGKATTLENVFGTLAMTFEFLSLPRVADTVHQAHRPGARIFDVEEFVTSGHDTAYLLGRDDDLGGVGPLFSALVGEIYEAARAKASRMRGGRLDPPLTFALDEAALICPVPLQKWTADSRGLGITVHGVFQSPAQIYERWGKYSYQTIWDNCTKLILGGLSNKEHTDELSTLCGVRKVRVATESSSQGADGKSHTSTSYTPREEPVMRPDEIKDLPPGEILILRRSLKPVIVKFENVWERRDVKGLAKAQQKEERAQLKARKRAAKQQKTAETPAGNPWATEPGFAEPEPWTVPAPESSPWTTPAPAVSDWSDSDAGWSDDGFARPHLRVVPGEVLQPSWRVVAPPIPDYDPTVHLARPEPAQQPSTAGDGTQGKARDMGAFLSVKIDPEKMLTALAGDLADLRSRVTAIEGQDLGTKLGQINDVLAEVIEAVSKLQPPEEEGVPGPTVAPNWAALDQEQAGDAWEVLVTWCRTVYRPMYAPQLWRPCWYQHPLLRVQLSWLCANWHWSYAPKCPPTRAAEWHARWWPHVRSFMEEELGKCGHRTDRLLQPLHEVPTDLDETAFEDGEMSTWIEQDIARRPKPEKKNDGD